MIRHLVIAFAVVTPSLALAEPLSKEACVDAHSRGQDARDQGKIVLAKKLFLTCAQSGCPAAVQADCARFADDVSVQQPTVNFVARDGDGNDLPNTKVYVDGVLVATSIDGRPVEIDPGSHTVKFTSGGKQQVITVVIGAGEKGRVVQARFGVPTASRAPDAATSRDSPAPRPRTTHPRGSLGLAITGGVAMVAGGALAFYGRSRMPAQCELSTNECAAPPGDPVFGEAKNAAGTINAGLATAGIGALTLAGGLVWYYAGAKTESPSRHALAPWVSRDGGGVSLTARF